MDVRFCLRCYVVLVHVNGSPRNISGAGDNYVDRVAQLLSTITRDFSLSVFLI